MYGGIGVSPYHPYIETLSEFLYISMHFWNKDMHLCSPFAFY